MPAKLIEMARIMGGLASDEADTAMNPGDTYLLSLMNKAKNLAMIFVPCRLEDASVYANDVDYGTAMTGKFLAYLNALDLTGTPLPSVALVDGASAVVGPSEAGYAWWRVKTTVTLPATTVHKQVWLGATGTPQALHIPEPATIDANTYVETSGPAAWVHLFSATMGALGIALWNRNLELATLHASSIRRMLETAQETSSELERMVAPMGRMANRGAER